MDDNNATPDSKMTLGRPWNAKRETQIPRVNSLEVGKAENQVLYTFT